MILKELQPYYPIYILKKQYIQLIMATIAKKHQNMKYHKMKIKVKKMRKKKKVIIIKITKKIIKDITIIIITIIQTKMTIIIWQQWTVLNLWQKVIILMNL